MFASPAYAQSSGVGPAGAASAGGGAAFLVQVAPLLLIFVIFYFLMIRPQQTRARQHRALIEAVKKGDTVVTAGGIVGRVTKVEDAHVEVEVAANTRVRIVKSTLADVQPLGGAKPAND